MNFLVIYSIIIEILTFSTINCQNSVAVSVQSGNYINIYNSSKTYVQSVGAHLSQVRCFKKLTNGRFASGGSDKVVKIWNTTTWNTISTYIDHTSSVNSISQIDDSTIASCAGSYFDISSITYGNKTKRVYMNYTCKSSLLLSNGLLATGDSNGRIQFWNLTSSTDYNPVYTIQDSSSGESISDIALIDSTYLATASTDNKIKIWNYQNYTSFKNLTDHTSDVSSVKLFSSKYLISGSYDFSVIVWDLASYTKYKQYTGTRAVVSVDVYSSDVAVFGDLNSKLIYFNISTGASVKSISTGAAVYTIASF